MKQLKRKIAANLSRVRENISAACQRASRDPAEVTLVAVTKSVGVDVIRVLVELGQIDLGENRVQELVTRSAMLEELQQRAEHKSQVSKEKLPSPPIPRWHMIGHLQRNKVGSALRCSRIIHSVDSLRLAEEINDKASKQGVSVDLLMEVNCSGESSKYGVIPAAVNHLAEQFATLKHLRLMGLMTMSPWTQDPETSRPVFIRLRELLEDMHREQCVSKECVALSMGTSQDYTVAIEEGATIVRVGQKLFEGI